MAKHDEHENKPGRNVTGLRENLTMDIDAFANDTSASPETKMRPPGSVSDINDTEKWIKSLKGMPVFTIKEILFEGSKVSRASFLRKLWITFTHCL